MLKETIIIIIYVKLTFFMFCKIIQERREWDSIIEKLTQYLRKAADQAYEENRITKDQRLKYFYSGMLMSYP